MIFRHWLPPQKLTTPGPCTSCSGSLVYVHEDWGEQFECRPEPCNYGCQSFEVGMGMGSTAIASFRGVACIASEASASPSTAASDLHRKTNTHDL